jgi:hypothetical protein
MTLRANMEADRLDSPVPEGAHDDIRALYEYWCGLTPNGEMPGRQHFDPLDIPQLLPNIWLIEVHREPLRFWRRVVGSRIEEFAGRNLTKGWVAERLSEERLSGVYKNLTQVVDSGQPSWRRGKSMIYYEKGFTDLERLYLPMSSDGETVDMILAMTVFYPLPLPNVGDPDQGTIRIVGSRAASV